jgi:hypothetical protein
MMLCVGVKEVLFTTSGGYIVRLGKRTKLNGRIEIARTVPLYEYVKTKRMIAALQAAWREQEKSCTNSWRTPIIGKEKKR